MDVMEGCDLLSSSIDLASDTANDLSGFLSYDSVLVCEDENLLDDKGDYSSGDICISNAHMRLSSWLLTLRMGLPVERKFDITVRWFAESSGEPSSLLECVFENMNIPKASEDRFKFRPHLDCSETVQPRGHEWVSMKELNYWLIAEPKSSPPSKKDKRKSPQRERNKPCCKYVDGLLHRFGSKLASDIETPDFVQVTELSEGARGIKDFKVSVCKLYQLFSLAAECSYSKFSLASEVSKQRLTDLRRSAHLARHNVTECKDCDAFRHRLTQPLKCVVCEGRKVSGGFILTHNSVCSNWPQFAQLDSVGESQQMTEGSDSTTPNSNSNNKTTSVEQNNSNK